MNGDNVGVSRKLLAASLIGTTIELFDFYIYATASVLVFPQLFFPPSNATAARLASLATFGIAFLARPIGSIIFGHFGDRLGRKSSLVFSLLIMGVATVVIGLLPTYAAIGFAAPLLLVCCRFCQGLGLGGEWGGAVLLAIESAPPYERAWYGMFPQLGAPAGFFLSGVFFLVLSRWLTQPQFLNYGWRLPFLSSAALVILGLYVRLKLAETPEFLQSRERGESLRFPVAKVFRESKRQMLAGLLTGLTTFVLFYLMTVFALSWGTNVLGYERDDFLKLQLLGTLCFALAIPVGSLLAQRGRRRLMAWVTAATGVFGLTMAPIFSAGRLGTFVVMLLGMSLLGLTYGPLGIIITELFPTPTRYTGASLTFSFAAILGASIAPFTTNWLAITYGLDFVGYYVTVAAILTMAGLFMIPEAKTHKLDDQQVGAS